MNEYISFGARGLGPAGLNYADPVVGPEFDPNIYADMGL